MPFGRCQCKSLLMSYIIKITTKMWKGGKTYFVCFTHAGMGLSGF